VEGELSSRHAGDTGESLLHLLREGVAQWTAGDGEDDRERNDAVVQLQVAHHVELGDRTLELRIDHLLERLQDLVAIDLHAASVAPTCQAGGRLWAAKRAPMTSESRSWPFSTSAPRSPRRASAAAGGGCRARPGCSRVSPSSAAGSS